MSRLANPKTLKFDLVVSEKRSTVDIITAIARALKVDIGESGSFEYVKLTHVQHTKSGQEVPTNAN